MSVMPFFGYSESHHLENAAPAETTKKIPSSEEVREELQRVIESPHFRRSDRMTRFLQHIVEKALSGQESDIREYNLGIDVFDKDDSFDPRLDSVVRVEARRLRLLLDTYYRQEGADSAVRIEVPKGRYVPVIRMFGQLSPPEKEPQAPQPDGGIPAIAVLPFADLSPAQDQQYFCEGISEQLIDLLTGTQGVKVLSRTSSFCFRDSHQDAREIGKLLGARWIVEGSVRRFRENLRISARLVDASDGCQAWARSYELHAADIFEMQDQIAKSVSDALRRSFRHDARPEAATHKTRNLQAYDAYMLARHHLSKQTEGGFRKAIDEFRRAISLDDGYAPAYVGLSDCYRPLGLFCLMPARETMPKAKDSALKALVLDPRYGDAWAALGGALALFDHDWAEAEKKYAQALAIEPVGSSVRHSYTLYYLLPQRRFAEARTQMALASERDPLSPIHGVMESLVAYYSGDFDATIRSASSVLHYFEDYVLALLALGWGLEQKGMCADAIGAFERAREVGGELVVSMVIGSLGHAYARAGRKDEAKALLAATCECNRTQHCDAAFVYAGLRNAGKALDCLEDAAAEGCPRLILAGVDPRLAWLRTEPRFVRLAKKIGFKLP